MKAFKTRLMLPVMQEGVYGFPLKIVTAFLTKHPISKENFGGVQWRIAKRFYLLTPKNVSFENEAVSITKYNESDICFLCHERPECVGRPKELYEKCYSRFSDVKIRHHSLNFDRFLLSSLFDESENFKVIRNWTISEIYERKELIDEMLKFCADDSIPSRCDGCYLIHQCPQNFKLRALTERCFPAHLDWIQERLEGSFCVRVGGDLSFDFNWMSVSNWNLITHLVYQQSWICRNHSKVYGSRLMNHAFFQKTKQLQFWNTSPVKSAKEITFHPVKSNFDMFYALKALAKQARSLCVIGETQGGNLGPFTKSDSVSSMLKEISYYWPIIQQALAFRTDVWGLSHMS